MLAVFDIVQGIVSRAMGAAGTGGLTSTTLPQEIVDKNQRSGVLEQHPAVGCHAAGRAVYYSFVLRYDHDSIWAYV